MGGPRLPTVAVGCDLLSRTLCTQPSHHLLVYTRKQPKQHPTSRNQHQTEYSKSDFLKNTKSLRTCAYRFRRLCCQHTALNKSTQDVPLPHATTKRRSAVSFEDRSRAGKRLPPAHGPGVATRSGVLQAVITGGNRLIAASVSPFVTSPPQNTHIYKAAYHRSKKFFTQCAKCFPNACNLLRRCAYADNPTKLHAMELARHGTWEF